MELEQATEVRRLAAALAAPQTRDFEAWESLPLQAARQGGAGVLATLLRRWQQYAPGEAILCPCGQRMRSRGRRGKRLLTTLGEGAFARSFYQCRPCSRGRFPEDERLDIVQKAPKAWRRWLEEGDIDQLIRHAGQQLPASTPSKKWTIKQLCYFENSAPQMRYAEYREKKSIVGSGVVEAGCRKVVGECLKQSGMRWSVRGANAILAPRYCILSRRFEDFWTSRTP